MCKERREPRTRAICFAAAVAARQTEPAFPTLMPDLVLCRKVGAEVYIMCLGVLGVDVHWMHLALASSQAQPSSPVPPLDCQQQ